VVGCGGEEGLEVEGLSREKGYQIDLRWCQKVEVIEVIRKKGKKIKNTLLNASYINS
jgi:hypothetical protein